MQSRNGLTIGKNNLKNGDRHFVSEQVKQQHENRLIYTHFASQELSVDSRRDKQIKKQANASTQID